MTRHQLLRILCICTFILFEANAFPANEYEYSLLRDELKEAERQFEGISNLLTEDEKIVDHYLQHLKWLEFKRTEDVGFPPARPIEEMMDHILSSEVYRVLKTLPKGGNMHTHENHEVSKSVLLDIVYASDQFKYLYMVKPDYQDEWTLEFFTYPPDDSWIHVNSSSYTRDEILQHQTLIGVLTYYAKRYPSDSAARWRLAGPLFGRMGNLMDNWPIKLAYIEALYNASLDENIQYLETRKDLSDKYYKINESEEYNATYGRKYLETEPTGELEINATLEFMEKYMVQHPNFIGHKRIAYTTRRGDQEVVNASMHFVANLHRKYPDHIVAYDLVGEEDQGNSHLFYLRTFLSQYDSDTGESKVPFMLHTAETSWPRDLIPSENDLDPVSTIQNAYESILYGVNRVGHGLGFIKHPYLLNILKEKQIAVETCPISNQILGYLPDIRNHPGTHYLHSGVPIVLGSDDPATFGYDHFTIDWYAVFMAWGLELAELKKLATNSLAYSGMTESEKETAISGKWQDAWDKFIDETKDEACNTDFSEFQPMFGMVVPKEGAIRGTTTVHIYGRNFTSAICKNINCKFGDQESPMAIYVSNNHIICEAPDISESRLNRIAYKRSLQNNDITVPIEVNFGSDYIPVEQDFTYKYDPYVPTTTAGVDTTTNDDINRCSKNSYSYILLLFTIALASIHN